MQFNLKLKHLMGGLALCAGLLSGSVQANADEQRLIIADSRGDWGQLAPYLHMARGPGYVYTSFLFDTLVWKNDRGEIVPLLAQSWSSDTDQRCHHFTLNTDAQWHDGKPVTAADVAFTFNYIQQHPYRFVDVSRVETIRTDANRVSICLQKPDAQFIEQITGGLPILPRHIYAHADDPTRFSSKQALIGSGPYRLAEYSRAQGFYHLLRNEHWHLGKPRYPEVIINRLSPHAAATAMRQGEVDLMSISHDFIELFKSSGAKILETPSNHPYRLLFNHRQRFADAGLRQGMAQAINRQQLIELAFHGQALPARPAYRQQGSSDGLKSYPFDLEAATTQLQEAGWQKNDKNGRWYDKQGQSIELRLIAAPSAERLAKVLAQQLTAFGLPLNIALLQDVPLTQAVEKQNFDLALLTQSHQGNLDRFRTLISSTHGRGDQYLANTQLLQLLEQVRYETDPLQQEAILLQAEKIYNEDLPSLPLLNPINFAAERPGTGAAFTPYGIAMGIPLPLNKLSLFLPDGSKSAP
jgi:peptide/nickel transport system substrate-binding protein